eukprot:NODE_108_length_19701_cov_0.369452.p3 type:complete len:411 gc:universal NODE_108_length_19701_cov_0.369452:8004-9236(+)
MHLSCMSSPTFQDDNMEEPLQRYQIKYLKKVIKSLKANKDAKPFLLPVDPVKFNIPNYFDVIKEPMDLSTVEKKLLADEYTHKSAFQYDVTLIFDNCKLFNGEASPFTAMANNMQEAFNKNMSKFPLEDIKVIAPISPNLARPKRSPHPSGGVYSAPTGFNSSKNRKLSPELRFASSVIKELTKKKYTEINIPFLEPVDTLLYPNYLDVVANPMDFSLIRRKLEQSLYSKADEVYSDIKLVFANCYAFNPAGNPITEMGHKLETIFEAKWTEKAAFIAQQHLAQSNSKRKRSSDNEEEDAYISFLEKQIEFFTEQLNEAKQRSLKRKKKSDFTVEQIYTMKKQVTRWIPKLDESGLPDIIKMIANGTDLDNDQDEIEIDLDVLDPQTVYKIHSYLHNTLPKDVTEQVTTH